MLKNQIVWAITRYSNDGYSYIDTETLSCLPEISKEKANRVDRECGPTWAKDNAQGKAVEIVLVPKN